MGGKGLLRNQRAVALLLALLVTALLIALIFEFAYATRISLRSAVNFRDSERAYYLARSGVFLFLKRNELRDLIPQKEWGVVPYVSQGDTEVRIRWEDEKGKISIYSPQTMKAQLDRLFADRSISRDLVNDMLIRVGDKGVFRFLGELHEVVTEEEFAKIESYLTVLNTGKINIATASEEVLRSTVVNDLGDPDEYNIGRILADRSAGMLRTLDNYRLSSTTFTDKSSMFTIISSATVGEYTKTIEAIAELNSIYYWKVQ